MLRSTAPSGLKLHEFVYKMKFKKHAFQTQNGLKITWALTLGSYLLWYVESKSKISTNTHIQGLVVSWQLDLSILEEFLR